MEKTLYKTDKNNVVREWKISVKGSVIEVKYGTFGGKTIEKREDILLGKNIGKSNETTPSDQAVLEAESKVRKKIDQGYAEARPRMSGKKQEKFRGPMLAHDFKDFHYKITFPCYIQPKLDGYRMIYINNQLFTRNNKEYTILDGTDLRSELKKIKLTLDGELYVHDKAYAFENYGVLRKKKLLQSDVGKLDKIKYHVFDVINEDPFEDRLKLLETLKGYKHIIPVKTYLCKDRMEVDKYHLTFLKEGYEGSMVRNSTSKYINFRSYDLLKYKDFDDHEFKIVGFSYEKNLSDDNLKPVIWKCVTDDSKTFDVQSKGTRKERDILYRNGEKHIGKMLSVKFFGYTESGVPRFPKTLRVGKDSFRTI